MKVAAYCRLSVAQDVSVSIEGQKAILARYAEAHGYETTFYIDDGFSGSKSVERPAYNRMIAAIQRGEHELIADNSIDRLGSDSVPSSNCRTLLKSSLLREEMTPKQPPTQ